MPPDHALAQKEIFGPVLVAIRFRDEEDAIRIANGTPYGPVAGVWTRDGARPMRLARALRRARSRAPAAGQDGRDPARVKPQPEPPPEPAAKA